MINCNTFLFTAAVAGDGHFWNFGDGSGWQTGPQVISHSYDLSPANTYTVKYHYKDSPDCEKTVHVDCPPTPSLTATCNQDSCGGLCYTFQSNVPDSYFHVWNFGDGTVISCYCPEIEHCYSNVDTYNNINAQTTVTLSVGLPQPSTINLQHGDCSEGIFIGRRNEVTDLGDFSVLPGGSHNGLNNDGNPANDKDVFVYGRVRIDKHFSFIATNIRMEPGGGFDVEKGIKFYLNTATDVGVNERCPCMWRGIDVRGALYTEAARIHDALYAVRPVQQDQSLPLLRMRNTRLFDNYISLMGANGEFNLSAFSGNNIYSEGVRDWCSYDVMAEPFEPSSGIFSNDRGWSGIYLNGINTFRIPQQTDALNTFNDLANGIFMVNSNAQIVVWPLSLPGIRQCRFIDMLRGGYPVELGGHGINFLDTEGSHFLRQVGLGLAAEPTFLRCEVGIRAVAAENGAFGSKLVSTQNIMDEVEVGYRIDSFTGGIDATIKDNTILSTADYGHFPLISAGVWIEDRNQLTTEHTVRDNTIVVNQPGQLFGFGVFVRGNFDMAPEVNNITVAENDITVELGTSGVHVLQYAGIDIHNNTIHSQEALLAGMNGIYVGGGEANFIYCNELDGPVPDSQSPGNISGIRTNGSLDILINDNWVDNYSAGIDFDGNNGMGVSLRCNRMGGTERTGLIYGQTAVTGPQTDHGNTWEGDYLQEAAFHQPQNAGVIFNLFFARENTIEWPTSINIIDWFIPSENIPDCPANAGCEHEEFVPGPPAVETYRWIAQDSFEGPPGLAWDLEKYLYARLLAQPDLLVGDTLLQGFVNSRENGTIGLFYELGSSIPTLFAVTENAWLQVHANDTLMLSLLDELETLGAWFDADTLHAQYDSLAQEWLALASDMALLTQQNKSLFDTLHAMRSAQADSLLLANAAITVTEIYEQSEQRYFEVYLNTLGRDNRHATPTQLATLEAIAQLCPAEGGRAVYWAIGLYGHLTRELLEIQDCPLEYRSGADREKNASVFQGSLNIFPNPSSGPATLQYHVPDLETGEIKVFDSFGRSVATYFAKGDEGVFALPDFAPGVYMIHLTQNGQLHLSIKFIKI